MPVIRAEETKTIDAPAARVYAIIADYRDCHPQILPEKYFSDLSVERGGIGAGTEIRFKMHLFGGTRTTFARVDEPEPGRVLTETYPENGAVTTFVVQPVDGGERAQVTITTEWASTGIRGLVERRLAPPLLKKIYAEELEKLERYAQRHPSAMTS